ncbi:PAS domain-containing hybrid sensor histidine kinase/response regulator [Agaribacter marinus]|uniref:histidine kinase n=1 Tax=Agaribacter marinus TaxID=1431249 RepID=A0AA37WKQ8_9ALTE|nr:response regulator [Agaribacter marinus]GLR71135.1 hypothetical protein GCM10007852_20430 [Agaribacter marinus]
MTSRPDGEQTEKLEFLLNAIIDATPDLIFAKDKDFKYIVHNKAFASLVGCSSQDLTGKSDDEIFSNDESVQRIRAADQRILDSGETICNQETTVAPDGKVAKVDTLKAPFYNDAGEMLGLIGISRDVTKRVETEEALSVARDKAEAANQAKSDFLAKMSHEIRTPMNAVIGLSQLLRKSHLDVEQRDHVNKILNSAEVLLSLINDILDFSKIEAEKLVLEREPFNLCKVLNRTITLCELKAIEKKLEFVLDIPSDLPSCVMGDPNRLQQVLVNLANNAIKFTEFGHVVIKLAVIESNGEQCLLRFSVIDSGIGMSPDEVQRLFVAFEQIDNSLTRNYEGSGLGLVICKQIVEMMGSQITVSSEKGQGSVFSFDITLDVVELGHCKEPRDIDLSSIKALVVDDSLVARNILTEQLAELGMQVDAAGSGIEALALVEQASQNANGYELILMDWRMPEMDGIDAAKRIKQHLGDKHVPAILLLSAYDLDDAKEQAGPFHIDAYLEKPITPQTLVDTVLVSLDKNTNDAAVVDDSWQPQGHSPWDAEQFDLSAANILLVDDNSINRKVVCGFLADTNVSIDEALDGEQALEKIYQNQYDLVLMDIQMPKMDGYTATKIIREQARFDKLPIIAMTAHAMESDRERCLNAGMNGHLPKPIDAYELTSTLVQWIDGASVRAPVVEKLPRDENSQFIQQLDWIPQLSVQKALDRCQYNQKLYCKLVRDFSVENDQIVLELNKAYNEKDMSLLFLKVHSLKASLAYIGAFSMSRQCAVLERLISKHSDFTKELKQLVDELVKLNKAIAHILDASEFGDKAQSVEESMPELIKELLSLLENSDFLAEEVLSRIVKKSVNTDYAESMLKIAKLVEDIEFEKAHDLCLQVISQVTNK